MVEVLISMYDPLTIAEYLITLGKGKVTNLRLQKLMYYAQGFHMAYYQTPLFDADFEAWPYGPVLLELYHLYKKFGDNPIVCETAAPQSVDDRTAFFLKSLHMQLIGYTDWELVKQTHNESPWLDNFVKDHSNVIPLPDIKDYFVKRLRAQRALRGTYSVQRHIEENRELYELLAK